MDIPENIIIDFVEKICKDLELEYETFSKIEDVIVDSKKDFLKDDDNVEDYQQKNIDIIQYVKIVKKKVKDFTKKEN